MGRPTLPLQVNWNTDFLEEHNIKKNIILQLMLIMVTDTDNLYGDTLHVLELFN